MSEVSLQKLVKVLATRKTSPRIFLQLVTQLLRNTTVSDLELAESLVEVHLPKQVEYAVAYAALDTTALQRFMNVLTTVSLSSQRCYLVYLRNNYTRVFKNMLKDFVVALVPYTASVSDKLADSTWGDECAGVWRHLVTLWGNIIDMYSDLVPGTFKDAAALMMRVFAQHDGMAAFFTRKAHVLLGEDKDNWKENWKPDWKPEWKPKLGAPKAGDSWKDVPVRRYVFNTHTRIGASYMHLKKYVWLTTQLRQWRTDGLVEAYLQYYGGASDIGELVSVFFSGVSTAIALGEPPYVVFNCKNYIVSRLPLYFRDRKIDNAGEQLVAAVSKYSPQNITNITVGGYSLPYDLRRQFLRSCMYRGLLTLEMYTQMFPSDADTLLDLLIVHETEQLTHVDSLAAELHTRLLNVNTELTLLDESSLVEWMGLLATSNVVYSHEKQEQLNKIVHRAVDTLVRDRSAKLGRLAVAMARNPAVANMIFFSEGPSNILGKIVAYVDRENCCDDDNFQDAYANYGTTLCGAQALARLFGVDWAAIDMRDLFCGDFAHRFFFRHADDLTATVDDERVTSATALMRDWAHALFDVLNDLPDHLVRATNVKRTYQLLTIVFQQAILAHAVGALSETALHNGLDYLGQSFLMPCLAEIMLWLVSRIGPMHLQSETMTRILLRIMETNLAPHDANHVFKVMLGMVNVDVGVLGKNERAAKVAGILERCVNAEYASPRTTDLRGGLHCVDETLKQSVVKTVRSESAATTFEGALAAISEGWCDIRGWWACMLLLLRLRTLVNELHRCIVPSAHADTEVAKMCADFYAFLIATDADVVPVHNPQPRGTALFRATVDDHYASIFSESEKPDDMDFDMDDLFDADDLFGDTGMNMLGSRRPCSPTAGLRALTQSCTTWAYVLRGDAYTEAAAVARVRIAHEGERWRAHRL